MRRRYVGAVVVVSVVVAASAGPSVRASADEAEGSCAAWDVEYKLAARLELADTPMGAGNGTYTIGPGSVVLRFTSTNGGDVRMRSYAMREHFQIDKSTLFWTTHVLTDTRTTTAPDACGDIARGKLEAASVRWLTNVSGYRTDGTLTCDGSLCGSFGAPPHGMSELHIPAHAVVFSPFKLAPDMKTFTMARTFVTKTENPKQTAYVSLAGREVRRTCVRAAPECP